MSAVLTSLLPSFVSGGANLASSVLGYLGQRSANQTNLTLGRETNALNRELTMMANAQNNRQFHELLKYNSPVEQRRMLEEAGYNPGALTDTRYHTAGVSANAATPGNPMVAPHMQNELAYFNQLGEIPNNIVALAQAKKANEEAKGQAIQNEYTRQQLETMLQGLGLDNKMKELDYKFSNDSFEQRLERLYHDTDIALETKNEMHMRNALLEIYGEKDIKSKIDLAVATAEKARAEGKQALSQVDLNKILGETSKAQARYYDVQSWYQSNILKSEVHKNEAIAEEAHTQGDVNRYEAQIKRTSAVIGRATQNFQIKSIVNQYFNGKQDIKYKEALIRKIAAEVGKIDAEVGYLDVKTYLESIEEARKVFHEYIKMP